jgi:glycosyltransferase involved in cell wall biosynthesis
MKSLSVLIPAYNERATIANVIGAVARAMPDIPKEIVIVDDCSTDGTGDFLRESLGGASGSYADVRIEDDGTIVLVRPLEGENGRLSFRVAYHSANKGKGGAIQTALKASTGDIIVIQDADLEYDPEDWTIMYRLIAERRVADVVYGSRFYGRPHRSLFYHHFIANKLISVLFNLIYNQTLSDIEVCYKMITREVADTLRLTCNDFGIEVQISAQISLNRKWRIYETGISYYGRTYSEGKKINWKDGVKALWYLVKFRF